MKSEDWAKIKHFDEKEFNHPELVELDALLLLDEQRQRLGLPMMVTSDGRPPAENEAAGGIKDSLHPLGRAFDTKCPDLEPLDYFLFACKFRWTQVGLYEEGFIHLGLHQDPATKVSHFFGFRCPNCEGPGRKQCGLCWGRTRIYKPISQEILAWYLRNRIKEPKSKSHIIGLT